MKRGRRVLPLLLVVTWPLLLHAASSPFGAVSTFDTELTLKILAALGAAGAWVYQTRAMTVRGKIRADLEILEKYRGVFGEGSAKQAHIERLENSIHRLMSRVYRLSQQGTRGRAVSVPDLLLGIVLLGAAALGIAFSENLGPVWTIVITGSLAFVGVGALMNALDPARRS